MFSIPQVDTQAAAAAEVRQGLLTKPPGALGYLEDLSIWCAAVQGACPPHAFHRPALVILAGDHGIADRPGISAYPPEVTGQMVLNFVAGGAAANVLARQHGVQLHVFDISVRPTPEYLERVPSHVRRFHVADGSGRVDREDAIDWRGANEALQHGRSIAAALASEGIDLLVPGDMGIGNTTIAAATIGHFTASTSMEVTGTGTGIGVEERKHKAHVVETIMSRMAEKSPLEALAIGSSPDLISMVGLMLGCIEQRIPVLLDGVVSAAAALATEALAPGARQWMSGGHRSTEPAQTIALSNLGLRPILDLGMRLGEGTGGLAALPVLQSAALTLAQMATFDQARVSNRATSHRSDPDPP